LSIAASMASRALSIVSIGQAAFANKPCGSSTNLAAMPLSNSA
jgi:hypothetical protein